MAQLKNTSINNTAGFQAPRGTTAQRPSSPTNGQLWFNTTLRIMEFYDGSTSEWREFEAYGTQRKDNVRSLSKRGFSPENPATSAKEILYENPGANDGVYWINLPTVGVKPCYCDMTYNGGGWILIMKTTGDATLGYTANFWTTDNVLNETDPDITRNINAKYDAFNHYQGTDIMARWTGWGGHRWLRNGAWAPGTALANFQVYRNWGYPQSQPDWNSTIHSSQQYQGGLGTNMVPQYGTNLPTTLGTSAGNVSVRWGYRFNENGPGVFNSDDLGGGIGGNRYGTQYGAGDWFSCCGHASSNRFDRAEVYIR
jgi:hypothetical protein